MRSNDLLLLLDIPAYAVYDDNGEGGDSGGNGGGDGGDGGNTPPDDKSKKKKVEFTPEQQEHVNKLVAEERRKEAKKNESLITQLENLRNSSSTTAAEKEALEQRIEDLKNASLSEKQLADKERKKAEKKLQEERDAIAKERDSWKNRYESKTIERAILDAAIKEEAFNPGVIVTLLKGDTRLTEELDDEGKPTGELIPRVKVKTTKDGKAQTLDLAVTEAVKNLKEDDSYANLFTSGAGGGFGGGNNPNRRGAGSNDPPTDPAQYRLWREKNRDKVGAPSVRKSG